MAGRLLGAARFFAFPGGHDELLPSVPLQLAKCNKEGITIGRLHERLESRAAPREAG